MKFKWIVEDVDISAVKRLVEEKGNTLFVKSRMAKNVIGTNRPEINETNIWYSMISCLVTTQQRSGPDSKVNKFLTEKPFSLSLENCRKSKNLLDVMSTIISSKGIRRNITISEQAVRNFTSLESDNWKVVKDILLELSNNSNREIERKAARKVQDYFTGFGPKQSRNFLQSLGLTKFEIPIDSRITKWLNEFGFPIKLSSNSLSDQNYYEFILDAVIQLCDACDIYPCILDAVVFSNSDKANWKDENLVW